MKYRVENNLDLFEFHDTELSFVDFNNKLTLSARHLNIHENANENPHDCDMEIDFAEITFLKFNVLSFEPMLSYQRDDNGNLYTNESPVTYYEKEAEKHFLDEIKKGITINFIDIQNKDNKTHIKLSTCAPSCFFVTFSFDEVFIEWDAYCKQAWYELHKQYIHNGFLLTPTGEVETKIHIVHNLEDAYYKGNGAKGPTVSIGVKYNNEEFLGYGNDYLWVDAFADLQKKLPNGVMLKCCMTCVHGNMCPFGNNPGDLFCTKGLIINSKEDMCTLFGDHENTKIFDKITNVADSCNEYTPQSNDSYTYNNYLYYLEN